MQVAVERRPGSVVALTVTVGSDRVMARKEQLFSKHARKVTVPGFRPGKAPRKMLEERIDQGVLLQSAIEDTINDTYREALREQGLEPLEQGDIEDVKTGDDLSLTYTVAVTVRPEVELPELTSLQVTVEPTVVTDEQVEAEIENLRDRTSDFAEIVDEGIQLGDYVTIDYTMKVNGEPYPDGEVTGYPLEVGSDTFFPELNEGLIGVKQGDTVEITTTYPDDYSNADLAGKKAEFEVVVQQVRRLAKPEATDEWAQLLSRGELQTMDDLRKRLHENLTIMAAEADRDHLRNELLNELVAKSTLDVPETLVDEEYEHLMHDLNHRLARERMDLDEYAELQNTSVDDIRNERRVIARDRVRRSLILQEIARRERIFVSDDDIDQALTPFVEEGSTLAKTRKEFEKNGRVNQLASRLFHEKVLAFLQSQATVQVAGQAASEQGEEAPAAEKTGEDATPETA